MDRWRAGIVACAVIGGASACGGEANGTGQSPRVDVQQSTGATRCELDGTGCTPLAEGASLATDGTVETAAGGSARLAVGTHAVAELGARSTVAFYANRPGQVAVQSGTVTVRALTTAAAPTSLLVAGQAVQISAASTAAVRASGDGRATLTVHRGTATAGKIALHSGETVRLAKGLKPTRTTSAGGELGPVNAATRSPEVKSQTAAPPSATPAAPVRGFGTMTARRPNTKATIEGVRLKSHHVKVTIIDGFARTEIEEEFHNDTPLVLEGRYRFPLPPDASISRLALWVGDKLIEGEIVERKRAAAIFKSLVDVPVPRDPALLEWIAGSEFSLKIFPILPKRSRKVVLAYNQALTSEGGRLRYQYPMSLGADRNVTIDDFSISVTAENSQLDLTDLRAPDYKSDLYMAKRKGRAHYAATHFTPTGHFNLSFTHERATSAEVASFHSPKHDERFFALRLRADLPETANRPSYAPRTRAIVLDASHSQSVQTLSGQADVALGLLRKMEPDESFVLLSCDTACETFPASDTATVNPKTLTRAARWLTDRTPKRASDPAGALVAGAARLPNDGSGQLVYLGDGVPSAGELTSESIAARVRPKLVSRRVDLRLLGAGRTLDEVMLRSLAGRLGATYDRLSNGDPIAERATRIALDLRRPVIAEPTLELPDDAYDVHPRVLPNLRLGQEVTIVGKLRKRVAPQAASTGAVRLRGTLAGAKYDLSRTVDWTAKSDNPLIPRLWAERRIAALQASDDPNARSTVVNLSRRHHVMSRFTSLLALESNRMFSTFGIKRTTKRAEDQLDHSFGRPIPRVRMGSPDVRGRSPLGSGELSAKGSMWGDSIGDATGSGGLGLSGIGSGGGAKSSAGDSNGATINQPFALGGGGGGNGKIRQSHKVAPPGRGAGSGTGQGFGPHGGWSQPLATRPRGSAHVGGASVSGGTVDNAARVVARLRGAWRACYQRGLAQNPSASGSIRLAIRIGAGGEPTNVFARPSGNLPAVVAACVRTRAQAARFAPPSSGHAVILVPIRFVPRSSATPSKPRAWASWRRPSRPAGPSVVHRKPSDTWRTGGAKAIEKAAAALTGTGSRKGHERLIRELIKRGRFSRALTAAKRFAALDPDLDVARELLAYAAVVNNQPDLALDAVASLVETAPHSARAQARAARAFEAAGDERRACAHWRSLIELKPKSADARYQALRCRARVHGAVAEALASAQSEAKPGEQLATLIESLKAGHAPKYSATVGPRGQFEVSVECDAGRAVKDCPHAVVIAPNGSVFSPLTPAGARSGTQAVAFSGLRSGTYRTLLVGGSPTVSADVRVRVLGRSKKQRFQAGTTRTAGATFVQLRRARPLGLIGRAW